MTASLKVGVDVRVCDGGGSASAMVDHGDHLLPIRKRISSGSSSSSIALPSVFDGLSEEEIIEILRRLPLKRSNQCKSVSKKWLNLISSSHFARSYLRYHNPTTTPPQFAVVHRYRGIVGRSFFQETPSSTVNTIKLTLTPPTNDPLFQFLVSCDGWVLCSHQSHSEEIYYIVNPFTNHWISLPPIPRSSTRKSCRVGLTISVDQDSNTTSFRVVRFPPTLTSLNSTRRSKTLELDIFYSETGKWARSRLLFSSAKRSNIADGPHNHHAIAFRGKLHWLNVWSESDIFVYDPYDSPEKYQKLSLPKGCLDPGRDCFLGTCYRQGQKQLNYSDWSKGQVRIWELKEYDKMEWCLLHKVVVSELINHDWHPDAVAFHPWDRDVMLFLNHYRFLQCNFRSKTVEAFLQQGIAIELGVATFFLLELPWWPTPIPLTSCSNWCK